MDDRSHRLNSRTAFLDKTGHVLAAGSAHTRALLIVNVRHLREINITLGTETTDRLLLEVCAALSAQLRPQDFAAHLGGDEIGVFLTGLPNANVAELAATKLHGCVRPAIVVGEREIPVRLTIGIALTGSGGRTADELLCSASIALAQARDTDQDTVVFSSALPPINTDALELRKELRTALETSELLLYYQPKVKLDSGAVSGAEALMRWKSPARGWVRPDIFIPIAERSDLIEPLTFWSINAALRQCSICSTKIGCLSVAVNLSAKILHHPHLVEIVSRAMNIWGTAPGKLILEVTESAMMKDPPTSLRTLQMLAEQGVTLAIDDFGTGYSSLAYLKKLPIRELKIDKSFVLNMHADHSDENIVRAIVDLSHNLGVSVVAEGIENQETLDKLTAMGCDYAQGFYIAKPMAADEMLDWLPKSRWAFCAVG